jgi:hypothetical protein
MHYPRPPQRPQAQRVRSAQRRGHVLPEPPRQASATGFVKVPPESPRQANATVFVMVLVVGLLAGAAAISDFPLSLSTWLGALHPGLLASGCC